MADKVAPIPNATPKLAFAVDVDPQRTRQPKRILHFSDGILEEYSSDEDEVAAAPERLQVNPHTLSWATWAVYFMTEVGKKSLAAADFCGEKLAWLFGITTPKYQYAIEEYRRRQKELEEELKQNKQRPEETQGLSTINVQVDNKPKDASEKY
ncbi:protein FAM177A1-like [Physella acuta]|uniref:protein FAM177A1-like n=1 Tax=Physella acuta TaxID=109671 RepID=UPI0027DCEF30|nr:protein FAM177A1-like [Physella acuta]